MFTDNQVEEMSKEAEAIAELHNATAAILHLEKENIKQKKYVASDSNVIRVDFSLRQEYEKAKAIPLKLPQVLAIYHDWAFRTYELAQSNKGHLKNKHVLKMIELNHAIIDSITTILPNEKS